MKTRLTILNLIIVLCCTFATTSVFGQAQTTYIWTNQFPANTATPGDLGTATNWSPNGVPSGGTGPDVNGIFGDELQWNGLTTGPLDLTANTITTSFSGSASGVRVHLTPSQTSPVSWRCLVPTGGGVRIQNLLIESGAGGLTWGDTSTNALDFIAGGVQNQVHGLTNNSTTAAVINPTVRWRMGGGGAHFFLFEGTGDWIVNNRMRSQNGATMIVQKTGSGTMTWTATNVPNSFGGDALGSPITIGAGTLIMKSSDIVGGSAGQPNIVNNGTLLRYDAPAGLGNIAGIISGTGPLQMSSGSLTLASALSTFTGNITLSGGTLTAGGAESLGVNGPLGVGGTISFAGGTLVYSANNAADYSPRFSTAAGQTYSIDTAGQSVTFATGLTSSGGSLTKSGNGTLTLAGTSTYSGLTTVSGGSLVFQGSKTGSGNITVADGATLDVFDSGTQVTPATLTLGSGVGAILEFDNIASQTTAPLAPGTISAAGTTVININSGTFSIGKSYPLLTWSSGSAPAVSLGIVDGGGGTLSTNGNKIQFNCTSVALIWSGSSSGTWDFGTMNWTQEGSPIVYSDPKQVVFNDTVGTGATNVTISGVVKPEALTVNNTTNPYSIASSSGNVIGGSVRFGKRGSGTLTLSGGANTNTGVTTLRGGTVILGTLANGGSPSDIGAASSAAANLVFNGGALQYTGGAASLDRLFTVAGSGGAIDVEGSGALTLNNPGVVIHSGSLTLNGNTGDTNTLASALIGGGAVVKSGTGTWVLSGTNGNGGGTTIANGVLQVGAGGGTGGLGTGPVVNNSTLDFERTGTLTVPGAISGTGLVTQNGTGTVILTGNSTYSGGTTINAGTLQLGNGGGSGSLLNTGPIVNNSLLIFNNTALFEYNNTGLISGAGNVVVRGGGITKCIGNNTYTGWTQIDAGSTFFVSEGQTGTLLSSVVTNSGTLRIVSQDTHFTYAGRIAANTNSGASAGSVQIGVNNFNVGAISTFTGTNTYTGGTFIGGDALQLGDNATASAGAIAGNVSFVNNFTTADDNNRILIFNRPDNFTFSGNIVTNFATPQNNLGIVQQNGNGTLTLTGNNTYGGTNNPTFGGTVVNNNGFLVVGNGGSTGTVGKGPVTLNNVNPLVINRSGTMTPFGPIIGGINDLLIQGGCTVTINGNSTYTGTNGVLNGTLIVNGTNAASSTHVFVGGLGGAGTFTGPITLDAGTTLTPGASVGILAINSDFTNNASTFTIEINKTLSPSNDIVNVSGALVRTVTGGTMNVHNLGPNNLVPGDKFTLFSQPLPNGASITVTGARATWVNNLAFDGSISVDTLITTVPPLIWTKTSTNTIVFSWSDPFNAFKLQSETNTITGTWLDYPGGGTSPITVPIVKTNTEVFFRLVSIP